MTQEGKTISPLPIYNTAIKQEWIDRNDHMNNSFYLVASQAACLGALRTWRGDVPEGGRSHFGNFVTQALVTYIKEVRLETDLLIRCRLVDCDDKRAHVYAEMIDGKNNKLLATIERTSINVQRGRPNKVVPYPDPVQSSLTAVKKLHAAASYLENRSPLLKLKQDRSPA